MMFEMQFTLTAQCTSSFRLPEFLDCKKQKCNILANFKGISPFAMLKYRGILFPGLMGITYQPCLPRDIQQNQHIV